MHDETTAKLAALLACEGWPLIQRLFGDSEYAQLLEIRKTPLGPTAEAAAVKLAHIEELRDMIRSITPEHFGDPFDVAERPHQACHGPEPEALGSDFDEDEYEL